MKIDVPRYAVEDLRSDGRVEYNYAVLDMAAGRYVAWTDTFEDAYDVKVGLELLRQVNTRVQAKGALTEGGRT